MSNPESFIDEVSEEVRRDQLFKVIKRYGWIAVAAVVAIVGGASYFEWTKARETAAAQALGDATLTAMQLDSPEARLAALDQIDSAGSAQVMVDLLAAGEELTVGNSEAAQARLQAVINQIDAPEAYRQLATLKLVMMQGDSASAESRRAAVEPMTAPGQAFRPIALEQLALIAVEEGDTDTAITLLNDAYVSSDATSDLRQRVSQLIVALGGDLNAGQ